MIIWWMMFHEIICPVMYSLFPISIEVYHFCVVLYSVVSHVPVFGMFRLHEISDDANSIFLLDLGVFTLSDCGWFMAISLHRVVTIYCTLSNIPPVSGSDAEATKFLSVWQMIRMELFSFGFSVLVVGGRSLRYKRPAMRLRGFGKD